MIDQLIKQLLYNLPKDNSESVRSHLMNQCIADRLNRTTEVYTYNEDLLFKLMDQKSTDTLPKMIKKLRQSNRMIEQSDSALTKLFTDLRS